MPTNDERREVARSVRSVIDGPVHIDMLVNALGLSYAQEKLLGFYISESSVRHIADLIEPEPERTCKWVWGEEWLESSPESPRELQWANWYLNCGCWDGDEDEFEDFDNPEEMPKGNWAYCPRCGAKVVDK